MKRSFLDNTKSSAPRLKRRFIQDLNEAIDDYGEAEVSDYPLTRISEKNEVESREESMRLETENSNEASSARVTVLDESIEEKIYSGIETDDDKLFLLSLVNALKQVPEDRKLDVKLEIMQSIRRGQKKNEWAILPSTSFIADDDNIMT